MYQRIKNHRNIEIEEIAIVVQGPFLESTSGFIAGLRHSYPNNQIILSTWSNVDLKEIGIVTHQADDPGALLYVGEQFFANCNRQLVSTREGIDLVTKPYVIKIRSDFELKPNFELLEKVRFHLDKHHILIDTNRKCYPFFPWFFSDFISAGSTELMKKLWSAPLATQQHAEYFTTNPKEIQKGKIKKLFTYPSSLLPSQWSSEQYIFTNFAKSLGVKVKMRNKDDFSINNLIDSYKFARKYLSSFKRSEIGLRHKKHFLEKQPFEKLYWVTFTLPKSTILLRFLVTSFLLLYLFFHFILFLKAKARQIFN